MLRFWIGISRPTVAAPPLQSTIRISPNPLMAAILEDALARDVHCLVTSCPMCQLNLDAYQGRVRKKYGIEKEIPVYFITEMVGLAMGKDISQLQIDRHLVDSVGPLKELGLS